MIIKLPVRTQPTRTKPPATDRPIHPLIRFAYEEMVKQKVSQLELAYRSGIADKTLRAWRLGATSPKMMDVEAVLNTLGYKLVVAKIPPKPSDVPRAFDMYPVEDETNWGDQ